MVAATRNGDNPDEVTGFTAWAMGTNALRLDGLAQDDAGRAVIRAIEAVRPSAKGRLELIGVKSWGRDPAARGAWAYFKPGQVRCHAASLGRRHGRVHFCGEHLARGGRGMEGAMESAERAAVEALAQL
jgi:monoamine oxidase